jgi:hypothetical protein
MNNLTSTGRFFFNEILYMRIFRKYVEKIQVTLKSDKSNGDMKWRRVYVCGIIALNYCWNNPFRVVEKIKKYVFCSVIPPPPPENRAVYEVMWTNMVGPDRPQMTIWRMRIA